jgi:hypothetical protein
MTIIHTESARKRLMAAHPHRVHRNLEPDRYYPHRVHMNLGNLIDTIHTECTGTWELDDSRGSLEDIHGY